MLAKMLCLISPRITSLGVTWRSAARSLTTICGGIEIGPVGFSLIAASRRSCERCDVPGRPPFLPGPPCCPGRVTPPGPPCLAAGRGPAPPCTGPPAVRGPAGRDGCVDALEVLAGRAGRVDAPALPAGRGAWLGVPEVLPLPLCRGEGRVARVALACRGALSSLLPATAS